MEKPGSGSEGIDRLAALKRELLLRESGPMWYFCIPRGPCAEGPMRGVLTYGFNDDRLFTLQVLWSGLLPGKFESYLIAGQ